MWQTSRRNILSYNLLNSYQPASILWFYVTSNYSTDYQYKIFIQKLIFDILGEKLSNHRWTADVHHCLKTAKLIYVVYLWGTRVIFYAVEWPGCSEFTYYYLAHLYPKKALTRYWPNEFGHKIQPARIDLHWPGSNRPWQHCPICTFDHMRPHPRSC